MALGQGNPAYMQYGAPAGRAMVGDGITNVQPTSRTPHSQAQQVSATQASGPAQPQQAQQLPPIDRERLYALVAELTLPEKREDALVELSKRRETIPDLAPLLWYSTGETLIFVALSGVAS